MMFKRRMLWILFVILGWLLQMWDALPALPAILKLLYKDIEDAVTRSTGTPNGL